MATTVDKIKAIEDEMAKTQKNKATSFHLGQLKAKLARLKRELLVDNSSGGGGNNASFEVSTRGVTAAVGMVGLPSTGKSTLLNTMTGTTAAATSEVQFTTLVATPGIIYLNGARLMLMDLPGIIEGAKDGKGRGKQVIAAARSCSMIFIVLDVTRPLQDKRMIERELEGVGIRLNKSPPNIVFKKKEKGGINITTTVAQTKMDNDEIKAVMSEYRINSADIALRCDASVDDLIDILEGHNRRYVPAIYVLNKIDSISIEELDLLYRIPRAVPISAGHKWNLDELQETMWEHLNLIRVYTKPKGRAPDYEQPVVLRADRCKIEDFCKSIHKSIIEQFKQAVVYGSSVKHQPQNVGLQHVLQDEDVVTILKK